jgi:outer membrane receptor protein involved in Fe transport
MTRHIYTHSDYSDYSFFYDSLYGSLIYDGAGNVIDPSQGINGRDHFTKLSQELRFATPRDDRLRFVGGLFYQRQTHRIEQQYYIRGLDPAATVTGWPDTQWLTREMRVDRDYALFGEVSFDITSKLTLTGGIRGYIFDNSLAGFFGYQSYEALVPTKPSHPPCLPVVVVAYTPCTNVDQSVNQSGETHRVNLTYQIDPDRMVYFTWSTGFRPGGVNRNASLPPYGADTLTNYEVGWKTMWLNGRVRFNGALFWEDWSNIQFTTIPPASSGLTQVFNAGSARVQGIESDLTWRPDEHWVVNASAAYVHARLTQDYVKDASPGDFALAGTQLPVTPRFKGSAVVRYNFTVANFDAHLQGATSFQTYAWPALLDGDRTVLGKMPGYVTADFTAGLGRDNWWVELSLENAFDERGQINRFVECATGTCGPQPYILPIRPRLVGLRIGQRF